MNVRDAVERDAPALAEIADAPVDAMRNLVHDRTVRVVERKREMNDPNADAEPAETELLGFVSFDVRGGTVHVTQFGGTADAVERLLAEPVRFADREGMAVEMLVVADDGKMRETVERAGFREAGAGPTFEGDRTVRYRMRP